MADTKKGAKGKTPAAKPLKVKVEISDIKVEGEAAMPAVGRRQLQQRKEAHKCWAAKTYVLEHGSEEDKAELSKLREEYAGKKDELKTMSEEEFVKTRNALKANIEKLAAKKERKEEGSELVEKVFRELRGVEPLNDLDFRVIQ